MPWHLPARRGAPQGRPGDPKAAFEEAASVAADGAGPLSANGFKVPLLQRTIVRALLELTGEELPMITRLKARR